MSLDGKISPEEELNRQVLRLETLANNLVILFNKSLENPSEFEIESHIRRISEYIQWWENIYPTASEEQQERLRSSRQALSESDTFYAAALSNIN